MIISLARLKVAVVLLVLTIPLKTIAQQNVSSQGKATMRILALFSGAANDLGLDHRLGRQVLKLAVDRAKNLHPNELEDIELLVYTDNTECTSSNLLPNRVADLIYSRKQNEKMYCNLDHPFAQEDNCTHFNSGPRELNSYLNITDEYSAKSPTDTPKDLLQKGESTSVDAIIGPSCDYLVDLIARMAAYWQKPIYTVTSVSASFSRKDIYSTLTRLSPSIDHLSLFLVRLLEKFKWRHLALIVDKTHAENSIILENIEKTIDRLRYILPINKRLFAYTEKRSGQMRNNSTLISTPINSDADFLSPSGSSLCTPHAREVLMAASRVARVYLFLINDHQQIRRLLLCAYELRMNNGEYTFLAFNLGLKSASAQPQQVQQKEESHDADGDSERKSSSSRNTKSRSQRQQSARNFDWYSADDEANNLIARQMFESLMVFSVELPISEEYNLFVEQTLDLVHQEHPNIRFEPTSVGSVAVALHDSLLVSVEAFLRNRNKSLTNGLPRMAAKEQEFVVLGDEVSSEHSKGQEASSAPLMWNERYANGLISSLHINSRGDQELDYVLSDLEPEMGLMRPVASYSKETRQVMLLPGSYIHWPMRLNSVKSQLLDNDEPPPDEPECGFTGEAERCIDRQNLYAALVVLAVLTLIFGLISGLSLRRYKQIRYQMQLDDYWWQIKWSDFQFLQTTGGSLSSNPQSVVRAARSCAGSVISGCTVVSDAVAAAMMTKAVAKSRQTASGQQQPQSETRKVQRKMTTTVPVIITSECGTKGQSICNETQSTMRKSLGHKSALNGSDRHTKVSSLVENSCIIRSEFSAIVKSSLLAVHKGELVIVKRLNSPSIEVNRDLLVELKSMRDIMSENLARFVGLCLESDKVSIVYEFCSRGSLRDMLLNDGISMDWTLKYSIMGDILNGLNFIHTTLLDYHGRLKSTNLVLDSRFTVKITDYGLQSLYSQLDSIDNQSQDEGGDFDETATIRSEEQPKNSSGLTDDRKLSVSQYTCNMDSVSVRAENRAGLSGVDSSLKLKNRGPMRYFWTAPEHLREKNPHACGSKKGDIYALAIIMSEILTRKEPYYYGTNARPHMPTIQKVRRQMQQNCQQQGASSGGSLICEQINKSKGDLQSNASFAIGSIVGRQAKRVQGRFRRTSNSVRPSPSEQNAAAEMATGDTCSIISVESSRHSESSVAKLSSAGVARTRGGTICEEELEVGSLANIEEQSTGGLSNADKVIDAEDILDQLRMGIEPEPVRPYIPNFNLVDANPKLVDLMRSCWSETPNLRPSVAQVRQQMRKFTRGAASKNYLDNLLDRLQNYAANLEQIVDGKSADIVHEKQRTEELLYQLVPKFVADKLKRNEPIVPQIFDGVTIFFCDIVGFEKYASVMSPRELVDLLNSIYSSFESIISSFDVTKIEVILDQFLVAAGISLEQQMGASEPEIADNTKDADDSTPPVEGEKNVNKSKKFGRNILENLIKSGDDTKKSSDKQMSLEKQTGDVGQPQSQPDPTLLQRSSAEQIARMALCIRDLVRSSHFRQNLAKVSADPNANPNERSAASLVTSSFNIRIGIHSGKICAGIVGLKRPKFCLIGDTVNVASRMHTNSKANKIQISSSTKELLKSIPGLSIEPRGKIEVKGKGMMETFWLESSY